jgi:hypothetical protein
VSHALKLQRVEAYIARMDSLVDKRHRCTWRVVLDAAKLASRLESVLSVLGIEGAMYASRDSTGFGRR